ncbi:MAG: OmpA family protein [Bacteroidales bacterium]|nr:OmpA family protein [Bacteroidales bacterium]
MKRFLMSIAVLAMLGGSASAQGLLQRLGDRAKDAMESNVGNKVEQGVNDAIDGVFNKKIKKNKKQKDQEEEKNDATWTCPECGAENTGKFCEECGTKRPAAEGEEEAAPAKAEKPEKKAAAPKKQAESAYAKSDFVPGDEIIFDDDFSGEKLGEFPSQWDLMGGYAEVGSINGRKVIAFTDDGYAEIQPLMKDQQHFLPDVFTLEFDVYLETGEGDGFNDSSLEFAFGNPDLPNWNGRVIYGALWFRATDGGASMHWTAQKPNGGDDIFGEKDMYLDSPNTPLKDNAWNHIAFSFNKRAFKGYVNGMRVINIPNAKVPSHFWFVHQGAYKFGCISNVRIAKGAVPLYDRLASDGKIVTYAITFETGKADLKPESMVEINRIAKLMKDDSSLKFEVQGHCDSTGSDKVNDPLSQKRAEAIVAALVEQGIAKERLTAVGKGSHVPIADNNTDEGRAKNRRVEFVKK